VASIAERGYLATTVNDLASISGVSSRTFYELFPSKEACFMATLEALIEATNGYSATGFDETARNWGQRARLEMRAFGEMIVAQPAASRVALIEAYTVGPQALVPLQEATARCESLTRQVLQRSPHSDQAPAEMVVALTGSQQEVARTRLWQGRERELPRLMEELWKLLMGYQAPPESLRKARGAPRPQTEISDAHDHAERALQALATVVAEEGYAAATIDAVLKRAQMSATTFYANFAGKGDAMLAAVDSACSQVMAATLPASRRAADWPRGIRAALGVMFNFLASRPSLANMTMVEVYAAGPEAMQRRLEALRPLQDLVAEGFGLMPELPPVAAEGIVGGVCALAYRQLREGGAGALPALAPICSYIVLSPVIGPKKACQVVNGD
jgi:AcrR family transcriptional regulator